MYNEQSTDFNLDRDENSQLVSEAVTFIETNGADSINDFRKLVRLNAMAIFDEMVKDAEASDDSYSELEYFYELGFDTYVIDIDAELDFEGWVYSHPLACIASSVITHNERNEIYIERVDKISEEVFRAALGILFVDNKILNDGSKQKNEEPEIPHLTWVLSSQAEDEEKIFDYENVMRDIATKG